MEDGTTEVDEEDVEGVWEEDVDDNLLNLYECVLYCVCCGSCMRMFFTVLEII